MGTLRTPEKFPEPIAKPKDLEALARSIYESFNSRKLEDAAALVADDCEWLDVASGAVFRGPGGFLEYDKGWVTAFSDARIEITNVIANGDLVVTEFTGRGTHDGPLLNGMGATIPPTGKKVELSCIEVLQFRAGKVIRARNYYNSMSMLSQLGVLK